MLKDQMSSNSNRLWTRPLYLQLRDALAERIATAEWKPGATIPNESDLAREFGVSAGTMRKALDLMEGERLLTRRQGRGTFVNDQASAEMATRFCNIRDEKGERIVSELKNQQVVESAVNEVECTRLRLGQHERVYRVRRIRLQGAQPFMIEEVSMPAELFPGLAQRMSDADTIIVLCQQYRILLGKAEERISIGLATKDVVESLGVAPASPIMVLDRVVLSLDGRPVEWRLGRCALGDRFYLAEMN